MVVVVVVGGGEHGDVGERLGGLCVAFRGGLYVLLGRGWFRGFWFSSERLGDFGDLIDLGDGVCAASDEEDW